MIRILTGDVREKLAELPDESVHCVVTSPPYWGLRDYGTAQWEGGDADCDHTNARRGHNGEKQSTSAGTSRDSLAGATHCRHCNARRIDRQLGMEPTLGEHIETMVSVFREVRRVLRKDGTVWLNYGDCYATSPAGNKEIKTSERFRSDKTTVVYGGNKPFSTVGPICDPNYRKRTTGGIHAERRDDSGARIVSGGTLKPKDLCMIPNRLAIALQDDGWWVRSEIIWHKPNPMPESVTDRPATAHEKIWLLTKSARYWYDAEAVRTECAPSQIGRVRDDVIGGKSWKERGHHSEGGRFRKTETKEEQQATGANLRNVWTVTTKGFSEAHFATFPPDLIVPCIKAGTSEKGCCAKCGAPWVREMDREFIGDRTALRGEHVPGNVNRRISAGSGGHPRGDHKMLGWSPSCKCNAGIVPCTVMDPFGGSGTTGMVADRLGRNAILIELNPDYAEMARKRIETDAGMFAEVL